MNANWYGVLPRWVRDRFGDVGTEMIGGIVGSQQEHHGAPYSITEDFVSVYRLHPLQPDDYAIRDHRNGQLIAEIDFDPIQGHGTRPTIDDYDGDIDAVDLQVGLLGEPLPPGFRFRDTAFRIFILMASRRLKSDRFFTNDYNPDVYTPEGIEWAESNTMVDVLLRHHPELAPALDGVENAFAPWKKVA